MNGGSWGEVKLDFVEGLEVGGEVDGVGFGEVLTVELDSMEVALDQVNVQKYRLARGQIGRAVKTADVDRRRFAAIGQMDPV